MAYSVAMKRKMERRLEEVYRECIDEMNAIEIPFGRIVEITVNYRAKKRWGQCCQSYDVYGECFKININADLCHPDANYRGLKETVIHEIIHTCPDCMCHTGEWKRLADLVNDCYGYHIKRCSTSEDKGMGDFYKANPRPVKKIEYKYEFTCKGCGHMVRLKKKTKFAEYYYLYSCGWCGGKFIATGTGH